MRPTLGSVDSAKQMPSPAWGLSWSIEGLNRTDRLTLSGVRGTLLAQLPLNLSQASFFSSCSSVEGAIFINLGEMKTELGALGGTAWRFGAVSAYLAFRTGRRDPGGSGFTLQDMPLERSRGCLLNHWDLLWACCPGGRGIQGGEGPWPGPEQPTLPGSPAPGQTGLSWSRWHLIRAL